MSDSGLTHTEPETQWVEVAFDGCPTPFNHVAVAVQDNGVVGVHDQRGAAKGGDAPGVFPVELAIQVVLQSGQGDVRQKRGEWTTLWSSHVGGCVLAGGERASLEDLSDRGCDDGRCVEATEEFPMVETIEELFDVDLEDPLRASLAQVALDEVDSIMGPTPFPESVLVSRKVDLPLGFQDEDQQRLVGAVD